ncbi:MAG: hypothetical protein AAF560_29205 [Acidobacteriota bacterium]
MRKHHLVVSILALGCLFAGQASAALYGSCGSCDYPYDNKYRYFSSGTAMNASDADQECNTRLSNGLPFGFSANGYVFHWVGKLIDGKGQFACYACVSNYIPDPFDENLSPSHDLTLETASSIAVGVYGGEVTTARRVFSYNEETEQAGVSFMFTLSGVADFEGGVGMVDIDPEYGENIRLHPVNCEER